MKDYDSRTYSINDFVEWEERKQLEISPKFQRRSVWSPQAKSYLMDTIIRGKPLPKIFIRQITNAETRTTIREIVDGQQRIRTILNFLKDGFTISTVHNEQYGGMHYSELPKEVKGDILKYEIAVDLLLDLEDRDILDIFARLNTYSVSLNKQELFNAKYFGYFKQLVYRLSFEYSKFWFDNELFTSTKIMRMAEAELTSDLLVAMLDGIQSKKNVEKYYIKYDENFEQRDVIEENFKSTMDLIGDIFEGTLKETNYSRVPVFYGLFVALYHLNFGIEGLLASSVPIKPNDYAKVRSALSNIDDILTMNPVPEKYQDFYNSTTKATTDVPSRRTRCEFMVNYITEYLLS
ncbi:DUF262 domain-containing protein [Aneurinibacillus sp. Ricciae_BoGa-3]|uniref:DUF262 domain-containing protein n=1 Tax=Aneurinibacillus sp. Ricciae_BoGa-3 TaxID=3022697 RepID=UPI00234067BA|nr:DUF262 domain-containing protein [Aneurinibacillus sp. Ricciae_BoGa-3]WCK54756.1 DUF262 domain-containing protein [Aneurinibacillus sp. Ricciae_BoGa-3]